MQQHSHTDTFWIHQKEVHCQLSSDLNSSGNRYLYPITLQMVDKYISYSVTMSDTYTNREVDGLLLWKKFNEQCLHIEIDYPLFEKSCHFINIRKKLFAHLKHTLTSYAQNTYLATQGSILWIIFLQYRQFFYVRNLCIYYHAWRLARKILQFVIAESLKNYLRIWKDKN